MTKPINLVGNTAKKPPRAGMGRPRGAKNKLQKDLKEMILGALSDAGGQKYLAEQAQKSPNAFMALVGKVLPMQVTGENGGPVSAKLTIEYVRPDHPAA